MKPTERHAFHPGSATYGQRPTECFYCWGAQRIHPPEEAFQPRWLGAVAKDLTGAAR